eukprot:1723245-Lingulodinium_polyedra.AAC.1
MLMKFEGEREHRKWFVLRLGGYPHYKLPRRVGPVPEFEGWPMVCAQATCLVRRITMGSNLIDWMWQAVSAKLYIDP